ncbi:MAG: adenosylmethionine decarboxylase [Polyangiaceae bacterium]|nr:adenosylmethionine decarboxylase [Polyangiaceae bacterium]
MHTLGRHLIAELYGCSREAIDDVDVVRRALVASAAAVGATVVGEAFHRFAPQGVSGTLVIAESHLSVHTWPVQCYVALDIFTCGGLDPRPGVRCLADALGAKSWRVQEILRGLPEDVEPNRELLPEDVRIVAHESPLIAREGPE